MEPELLEIQKVTLANHTLNDRFSTLFLWSDKLLKNESLDRDYYVTWQEAFEEIKSLSTIIKKIATGDSTEPISSGVIMFSGSLVKGAAVLLRDHYSEINSRDFSLGFDLIAEAILTHADSDNPAAINDAADFSGAAAAASVLPICLDFTTSTEEKLIVKTIIAIALTHENKNVRIEAAKGIKNYLWKRDPDFAQKCILGTVEYARLEANERKNFKPINEPNEWIADFREQLARGEVMAEINDISFSSHSPEYLMTSCFMIPSGSPEPNHNSLLLRMLILFAKTAHNEYSNKKDKHEKEIKFDYTIPMEFEKLLASHLFDISEINIKHQFVEQLQLSCDTSPDLVKGILLYTHWLADRTIKREIYWGLWSQLCEFVQKIAIRNAENKSQFKKYETDQEKDQRKLIHEMLFADMRAQYVDHERENLIYGKDLLINFVANAGVNPDVFEGMSSLIFYYPDLFFESGIKILSKHQKAISGTQLMTQLAGFYLERSINRFLYGNDTSISKEQYQSCQILLDALVDTGSSGAYYLREFLIRSKRVNN